MLTLTVSGCGRVDPGVPHPGKVLQDLDLDERPSLPSESEVMADLQNKYGSELSGSIASQTINAESHTFFVLIDTDAPDSPELFRVTYFLIDGEYHVVCERM